MKKGATRAPFAIRRGVTMSWRGSNLLALCGFLPIGITLYLWGQPLVVESGMIRLWVNETWSPETSQQIAELLFIAASTVEVHRRNIMRKLNLHSVAELTRYMVSAEREANWPAA